MDRFWLEKAHKYISEHNAFVEISKVKIDDVASIATISATARVNLPSRFIKAGMTEIGVKEKEEVIFHFTNSFPLKAPSIQLRDDFPRCFPHINPSEKKVLPCIYEGNLSELLQQSGWMNEILNQLVDWLEKAASNDLMNYDQGWEPMRNDHNIGFLQYDIDETLASYEKLKTSTLVQGIIYESRKGKILTGSCCNPEKSQKAHALYFLTPRVINNYVPNTIRKLSQLYEYAKSIGINGIKELVEEVDLKHISEDKLFIVLSVRRPVKIIGSESDVEFLNFVISKAEHRKKKRRELKRTLPDSNVGMLYHIAERSPSLLRRISGTQTKIDEDRTIALVGCGSLGSKIGIHLARNGNGPFLCVDNDSFMPHNNARHALISTWAKNKAELLSISIYLIGKTISMPVTEDALTVDYSKSRLIIDTTASLSVRNFLMSRPDLPSIISCNLYNKGRSGLMLTENKNKTGSLANIWAFLYYQALKDDDIHRMLFSASLENVSIGQSCSSQTMVIDDARISLMAATMSLKIQHLLETDPQKNAEILFLQYDDNYSLRTVVHTVPDFIPVKAVLKREWMVFISEPLIEQMRNIMHDKSPNETGGALLGSVFLYPKTVVITDIINAPPDSIETPTLFILGVEGLEKKIQDTEKKTNGKVTYLGTWHSHPHGGSASRTDERTFKKLLFVRNYEPTACLILTKNELIMV
jgi:integrative and conjugative element protein (TIGR02256 family)